jgi:hypothetical protein
VTARTRKGDAGDLPHMPKDQRQLVRDCLRQGWTWQARAKGALALFPPDGGAPVFMHGTPSDRRGLANYRAALRRAGYRDPAAIKAA